MNIDSPYFNNLTIKILHIGSYDKFVKILFEYLENKNESHGHALLAASLRLPDTHDIPMWLIWRKGWRFFTELILLGRKAEKIVIHGMPNSIVPFIFFSSFFLIHKMCWILCGGDLYAYRDRNKSLRKRIREIMRRHIISSIPQIFSATPGDGELCREWYGFKGKYVNIFTYPNSIIRWRHVPARQSGAPLQILVGNSSSVSNNHEAILNALHGMDDGTLVIHCPLAYGDRANRDKVIALGRRHFGPRFHPIVELVPYGPYLDFLASMDIGVFDYDRQQGMGTIRALLGFGKRVFLRTGTTAWDHLAALGVTVSDVSRLDLAPDFPESGKNREIICGYYSEENFRAGLTELFTPCRIRQTP